MITNKLLWAGVPDATYTCTKFRGNRSTGSLEEDFCRVFTIYGRGGNLGHLTSIMSNFHFLHTKFGSERNSSF